MLQLKVWKLVSSQWVLAFSHQKLIYFSVRLLGKKKLRRFLLLGRKVPSFKEYFGSFFLIKIIDWQPFFRPKLFTNRAYANRSLANYVLLALRHGIEKPQIPTDVENRDHNRVNLFNGWLQRISFAYPLEIGLNFILIFSAFVLHCACVILKIVIENVFPCVKFPFENGYLKESAHLKGPTVDRFQ